MSQLHTIDSKQSKHAGELCALLLDETYGELTSRIFAALSRRGRLQIHQITAHTQLAKRQVQHGLAVLIQQSLLYHCLDESDGRTYYEANHDAAYALVRTGKIVELVDDRFGGVAKDVMQNLLFLGHSTVSGLEVVFGNSIHIDVEITEYKDTNRMNGTNGINGKSHPSSAGQLHSVLAQLLRFGFIERVQERMFRSPTDTQNLIEKGLLRDKFGGQTKGTKQKDELKVQVREQLKSWRDEGRDWLPTGVNKYSNGVNGHDKKRKLSEAMANGNHGFHDGGFRLESNLILRVNYEKCIVALRNQRLVELANSRIGETTSEIYAEILRLLEESVRRCRADPAIDDYDDSPDPSVTTSELSFALSKTIKVSEGIGDPSNAAMRKAEKSAKERKPIGDAVEREIRYEKDVELNGGGNGAEADNDSDNPLDEDLRPAKRTKVTFQEKLPKPKSIADAPDDGESRIYYLKMHLQLLAQDSCPFIYKVGQGGSNEWAVDFERLVEHLRESEMDKILYENFGQGGLRLVRMLRKLGKIDEKALPNLALMKQKDIRTKMAEMQMAGMVDIQEVPRDAGRSVGRTIFLWYFDSGRVSSILLDNVYKIMSRCLQRLEWEKRQASGILSIMERSDVRQASEGGALEEVLDVGQLIKLNEFLAKEEMLLGQIARLDELVGIFRDY